MSKIIGNVQLLDHDIHYGYEGGPVVNFTIESKKDITKEDALKALYAHFNPKPIEQLKKEWKRYMPLENDFNLDLHFENHNKWASEEVNIII